MGRMRIIWGMIIRISGLLIEYSGRLGSNRLSFVPYRFSLAGGQRR